jgi:hypothetical protein
MPGDRFELPGVPHPGGYVGKIVLTEGWRGRPWTRRTPFLAANLAINTPAHLVEPSIPNGFAYRCLSSGVTGDEEPGTGTNPPWPTSLGSTVGDGEDIVWECYKVTPTYADYGLIVNRNQVVTTDARPTVLATYSLANDATTQIDVTVTAFQRVDSGFPDGATFTLRGAWCRGADSAPIEIKAPTVLDTNPNRTTWTAILELRGNNVVLLVSGGGPNVEWTSVRQAT